jgi:predicted lipid carrier protein YhbT
MWNVAVAGGHIKVLGRLWSKAKEETIKWENLNDKFFSYEYRDENFAWHLKVKRGNIDVSHSLLGLTEEAQIQGDDLRSAIFLALYKCEKLPGNWHKDIEG